MVLTTMALIKTMTIAPKKKELSNIRVFGGERSGGFTVSVFYIHGTKASYQVLFLLLARENIG
ncbi:MAG: hypothetical protein A3G08_03110 [Candidatus Magasanikbacteria bacterium RIFCSPLOWO2_12_FULL_47_9b]|nr:MAG: hypothetical protein A3G08_03110 [Candidatus Magasanikbacteria bacterium RIFCSPLOWO2_12_FULL_47_9b]